IRDLGSANGTYVNGRSASKPITLEHEDLITIGTVQLQFLIVDGERDKIAQRFSPGLEETDHVVPATNASALFAGTFTRETLHQDESRRAADAEEGLLDARPDSGEKPALPFSATKTQRIPRPPAKPSG